MHCSFKRNRLTGQHVSAIFALANAQGANAKRISKGQESVACNQGNDGIGALHAAMHTLHSFENIGRRQWQATCGFFQFVRQHIEQDFGVTLGIDMAMIG